MSPHHKDHLRITAGHDESVLHLQQQNHLCELPPEVETAGTPILPVMLSGMTRQHDPKLAIPSADLIQPETSTDSCPPVLICAVHGIYLYASMRDLCLRGNLSRLPCHFCKICSAPLGPPASVCIPPPWCHCMDLVGTIPAACTAASPPPPPELTVPRGSCRNLHPIAGYNHDRWHGAPTPTPSLPCRCVAGVGG